MPLPNRSIERPAAARLVVVTFVQQPLVEGHARLRKRALVALQALPRVGPVEWAGDIGDLPVLRLQERARGEVTAELVVEAEAAIGDAAHLAVHDHDGRVLLVLLDEEFVGQPRDVHDQRVAVAADEEANGFALQLLAVVTGRDQYELAGRAQRLLDRTQHRAVECAVQLRDQHADAVRGPRRERLRDRIRLVPELQHRRQHFLPRFLRDARVGVDYARDGRDRHVRELRDLVHVGRRTLHPPTPRRTSGALQYCSR